MTPADRRTGEDEPAWGDCEYCDKFECVDPATNICATACCGADYSPDPDEEYDRMRDRQMEDDSLIAKVKRAMEE